MVRVQTEMWQVVFSLNMSKIDFKQAITPEILSNPKHPFVKTMIFIYSMESFIFKEMN